MKHRFAAGLAGVMLAFGFLQAAEVGPDPVADSQIHLRDAAAAYRDGDLDAALASLEQANALNPASLYTRRNLARLYAQTGQPDAALAILASLVDERIDFGIADDPDLEALHGDARFAALLKRAEAATRPLVTSEAFFEFGQLGVVPEGIAADAETGRFFFGSMRSGDVYVRENSGHISRFGRIDAQNRLAAIGMTVDSSRNLLWVVGAAFDMAENYDAESDVGSGLYGFNLDTGELERAYTVEDHDANFNDVTVGPDGSVYVSGSPLYRLDESASQLVALHSDAPLYGANGLVVDPGGRTLFVASYPVGLAAVELATGRTRLVALPENLNLYGIDGLYWHDGGLIAVQNGARPWRLLRLEVSDDHDAVTASTLLEFGSDATTPMTGAIVGDSIYYVGEGSAPDTLPSHFPPALQQNAGPVVVRRAPLHR